MLKIYKASAGSGKTYTLAYEYIKMLLGVKNPITKEYRLATDPGRYRHRHIMAVTFSIKATDEMKQRIIHQLALLAGREPRCNDKSPYLGNLVKELHASPEAIAQAASDALSGILFDFNFFQVSTIDSFFQTILRTFAREADLAGNYEVDLDNHMAIAQGVHDLFDSLNTDPHSRQSQRITRWITSYLLSQLEKGKQVTLFNRNSLVHKSFLDFIEKISNDILAAHHDEMLHYLSDPERLSRFSGSLARLEEATMDNVRNLASRAIAIISSRGYDTGVPGPGKSVVFKVSHHLLGALREAAAKGEQMSGTTIASVAADTSAAFNKHLAALLTDHPDPELQGAVGETAVAILEARTSLRLMRNIMANLFVLGLLERVYHHIEKFRADTGTIFISDTNAMLRKIIGDDDAPFVYERIGSWIRHFLIDEFQDTSAMQWENLRPLVSEALATDDDSLIIGDEKQCIYRFRFSDPTLLTTGVASQFPDKAGIVGSDAGSNTNYRSSADIVAFNNRLFANLARKLGFADIYANVEQKIKNPSYRGCVTFRTIETADKEELQEKALGIMTAGIAAQLSQGYDPCDIAVLTRSTDEGAAVIAHLLEAVDAMEAFANIKIMSDDAMLIASAPAVRLIISVLRFITLPPDKTESSVTDRHGRTLRDVAALINRFEHLMSSGDTSPAEALRRAIADSEKGAPHPIEHPELRTSLDTFNLPSTVERIIHRYISPDMAAEQNMFISAFVDEVVDFSSRGTPDILSFLEWWDTKGFKATVSAPMEKNAIRVMTIHKSKGLEFKCVHIPFANWKMVHFKNLEWFVLSDADKEKFAGIDAADIPPMIPLLPSKNLMGTLFEDTYLRRLREQLLDELNVLYVALTRAVDQLTVICQCQPGKAGAESADPEQHTICGLLCQAIPQMSGGDNGTDDFGSFTRWGTPMPPVAEAATPPKAVDPVGKFHIEPYATSPRDDLWNRLDIDRLCDYSRAADRGTVLHDVLSHVTTPDTLPAAIRQCAYRGRLPREEADNVLTHLRGRLSNPKVAPWFNGFKKILRERELIDDRGALTRADRIVWTAQGTIDIIDYKFGQPRPEKHRAQIKAYMHTLSMLYPNLPVRGFIWYLRTDTIVPVN